jgi:hypothetical protein
MIHAERLAMAFRCWYKDGVPYVGTEGTLKRQFIAAVMCLAALSAFAEPPEEWPLERRLADRFDPVKSQRRLAAEIAADPRVAPDPARNSPGVRHYVINGRTNPELFLPHELFEHVLSAFQPDEFLADAQRELYGSRLGEFGWNAEAFWLTLERLSSDYVKLRYRTEDADPNARCRARFEALESARKAFGQKEFDAYLYRAIAPHAQDAVATNEANPAARLRREAQGCR